MNKLGYSAPLIVVFGGAGYLGSSLIRRLLREDFAVRVFDNFSYGKDGIADVDDPMLDVIEGDICDTKAVSCAVRGAEVVVLLAAMIGRRLIDIPCSVMRTINLHASSVVLDAAKEQGASRFLLASSDSVYGAQAGVLYETATPEPISLYSRLKLRIEERVLAAKSREFHPTVLRIATCHGFAPRMRFDLVANTMLRDAVCKKQITVRGGDQWRSMLHVDDAAHAFVSCIKAHENLVSGEVYNISSPEQNLQVKQIAERVHRVVPEATLSVEETVADLTEYHLSCSKAEKIIDFQPRWSLEQSLSHLKEMLLEGRFETPYSLRYQNT